LTFSGQTGDADDFRDVIVSTL